MKTFNKGDKMPVGGKHYIKVKLAWMVQMKESFSCESREGTLVGQPGDYLVQDEHGGFYSVSAKFHRENYELARAYMPPD